jgi:hypothetical protein
LIRYLNLPQIPAGIVDNLNYNFDQYNQHNRLGDVYLWSDSFNQDMYWGFQIISGDLPAHKDIGTEIKLTYLINTGGDRVLTNFYAEDKITVTDSYMIPEGRWHLLQANRYHGVHNVESTRFSVTGRVFPK